MVSLVVGFLVGHKFSQPVDGAKEYPPTTLHDSSQVQHSQSNYGTLDELALLPTELAIISQADGPISEQIVDALELHGTSRFMRFAKILENLSSENWKEAMETFDAWVESHEYVDGEPPEWVYIVQQIGEVGGKDAQIYFYQKGQVQNNYRAIKGWARIDPHSAYEWLETEIDPKYRDRIWRGAFYGIVQGDPVMAVDVLGQLPVEDRAHYSDSLINDFAMVVGFDETEELFNGMLNQAESGGYLDAKYLKPMFNQYAKIKMSDLRELDGGDKKAAMWLGEHIANPYVTTSLIRETISRFAKNDHKAALDWMDSTFADNPEKATGYGVLVNEWAKKDGVEPVGNWLYENQDHPHYQDIVWTYSLIVAREDPVTATEWAYNITDADNRASALKSIMQSGIKLEEKRVKK